MIIKDLYPSKAQYKNGEKIKIIVEVEGYFPLNKLICNIYKFHENIFTQNKTILPSQNKVIFEFEVDFKQTYMSGFGVEIKLYKENKEIQSLFTAFDILSSWKYAPRYGFLSDFSPKDFDDKEDIKQMNEYHLNVIQYYDWMYRHNDLISDKDEYIDPLNRKTSLSTIKRKIQLMHEHGMEALAYGAVYAASPDFYKQHKDIALYKNNDEVMGFSNFLYLMDISKETEWHDHIINEFYKAVKFGFDGIHMDQYGYPKEGISKVNGTHIVRNLKDDFPNLINDTRKYIEGKNEKVSLIFNAVNNWPVETVAKADEDAVYVEVWPPNDTYEDLYNLIANAKKIAPNKQVILAAYIKPFLKELNIPQEYAENAALLAMSTIFASGGFHLMIGEKNGILDDPYYPKYAIIKNNGFIEKLRNYYDFIVRFEELLFDFDIFDSTMVNTGGINGEYVITGVKTSPKAKENCVWSLVKEKPGYKIINLINFIGIEDMNWNNSKKKLPDFVQNIDVSILTCYDIKSVYVVSPDYNNGMPVKLNFKYVIENQERRVKFNVPKLLVWDLIYLEY